LNRHDSIGNTMGQGGTKLENDQQPDALFLENVATRQGTWSQKEFPCRKATGMQESFEVSLLADSACSGTCTTLQEDSGFVSAKHFYATREQGAGSWKVLEGTRISLELTVTRRKWQQDRLGEPEVSAQQLDIDLMDFRRLRDLKHPDRPDVFVPSIPSKSPLFGGLADDLVRVESEVEWKKSPLFGG
jgi:hypothetical protein